MTRQPEQQQKAPYQPMRTVRFHCEDWTWEQLNKGLRRWDWRPWDLADPRIYALAWSIDGQPEVARVEFVNNADGRVMSFDYLGVEFAAWAPGWGFLQLGVRHDEHADPEIEAAFAETRQVAQELVGARG